MRKYMVALMTLIMSGCLGIPDQIEPIDNFDLNKYLGKWYEIARLDHSFERGMTNVSANYSLKDDGGVKVINRGYKTKKKKWAQAEGRAYMVKEKNVGYLKVSFFGPFYGSYIIFELDENYQYAFVTSSKKNYLWFLSRTKTVDKELLEHFRTKARKLGFDLDKLTIVNHDMDDPGPTE